MGKKVFSVLQHLNFNPKHSTKPQQSTALILPWYSDVLALAFWFRCPLIQWSSVRIHNTPYEEVKKLSGRPGRRKCLLACDRMASSLAKHSSFGQQSMLYIAYICHLQTKQSNKFKRAFCIGIGILQKKTYGITVGKQYNRMFVHIAAILRSIPAKFNKLSHANILEAT